MRQGPDPRGPSRGGNKPKRIAELADPLWERQPGEGAAAYQLFRLYRDMLRRSQEAVAKSFGVSHAYVNTLAAAKRWTERADAYDAFLDTRGLAAGERSARSQAAKNAQRVAELLEAEWVVSKAARDKVLALIESGEGDPKTALRDAAALLRESGRLARLSVGLHTEGGKPTSPEGAAKDSDIDAFLDWLGSGPDEPKESGAPPRLPEGHDAPDGREARTGPPPAGAGVIGTAAGPAADTGGVKE